MSVFGKRLKALREKRKINDSKWTQKYVADLIGVARPTYTAYENGTKEPPLDTLNRIADIFEVKLDYLQGRTNDASPSNPYYALTDKDERDIAKDLERMMNDLESGSSMAFMGEPMDEEDRELLRISLENTLRMSREMAKKKFTPKKYRNRD